MSKEVVKTVCGFKISIKDNTVTLTDMSTAHREEITGVIKDEEFYLKSTKFNSKRFRSLPVNEFGFKTLIETPDLILMVTNNYKIVAYSDGVPSVVGYPSTVTEISGIYFNTQGNRLVPNLSFLTGNKLEEMYVEICDASFNFNENNVYNKLKDFTLNTEELKLKGDIRNSVVGILNTESKFINNFSGIKTKKKFLLEYIKLLINGGNYLIVQEPIIAEDIFACEEFEILGAKFILNDKGGSIKFGPNYSSKYKMNNGYTGYCPLSLLNIKVEDFHGIRTNERGFKTLVEFKDKSIELTSTGRIIFYEGGIPSLFGYPSDFSLFSGPIVREGSILIPSESVLSNYQISHLVFKQLQESFGASGDEALKPLDNIRKSYEAVEPTTLANAVNLYEFYNGYQTAELKKKIETLYGFLKISSTAYNQNLSEEYLEHPVK